MGGVAIFPRRPQLVGRNFELGPPRENGAVTTRDVRLPADHIRLAAAVQFCSDQAEKTDYDFWHPRSEAILSDSRGVSYDNCSASFSIDRRNALSLVRCDLCALVC
jgi:hypothetical protein